MDAIEVDPRPLEAEDRSVVIFVAGVAFSAVAIAVLLTGYGLVRYGLYVDSFFIVLAGAFAVPLFLLGLRTLQKLSRTSRLRVDEGGITVQWENGRSINLPWSDPSVRVALVLFGGLPPSVKAEAQLEIPHWPARYREIPLMKDTAMRIVGLARSIGVPFILKDEVIPYLGKMQVYRFRGSRLVAQPAPSAPR